MTWAFYIPIANLVGQEHFAITTITADSSYVLSECQNGIILT